MANNFVLNYSFSRNLNLPLDVDSIKSTYNDLMNYVKTPGVCYVGQLCSVTNDEDATKNGLYIVESLGEKGVAVKLATQEALDAVLASAGKIDTIKLNGSALTINDKTVNIDLSDYATVESVDTKISGLTEVYDAKGAADSAYTLATAYTENKLVDYATQSFVTDKIVSALTNGTVDITGYAKVEDVKNQIASAKTEAFEAASAYTDSEVKKVSDKIDILVGEDSEKSARAIAAEEVAKVVASANTDFDTLKEIADWITNDTTGAANMANDIASLKESGNSLSNRLDVVEGLKHNHTNKNVIDNITSGNVAAWNNAEQNAKDYADGLASNYDAAGAAASALTEAKSYADGLASNYDAAGAATSALTEAKSYADGLASNYDAAGAATSALTEAKSYTDTEIGKLGNTYATTASVNTIKNTLENKITNDINSAKTEVNTIAKSYADAAVGSAKTYADSLASNYDAVGSAINALNSAKTYVDTEVFNAIESANTIATSALTEAKSYADGLASNYDAAGAAASALTEAKSYADGLASNYDAAGAAASAAASALTDAKNFTLTQISGLTEVYDAKGAADSAYTASTKYTDDKLVDYATQSFVTDKIVSALTNGTVDITGYAKVEDVKNQIASAKTEAFEAASAYTDSEISKLSGVYASKSAVDTLVGEDSEKSARAIAAEEVAKVVAKAPDNYDTLKEIADYIANDITSAATIVNDIAELKAVSANTRLEALEAISGESHTHENKALLDTYTQTDEDLADAVSKKHAHENAEVLNGITSGNVAAWNNAEQNAKDYADGLVENIKPYEGGVAANISLSGDDTYVVDVKVSDSEKNFLNVNADNELEVSGITLDAAITSKEIVIEGGKWADAVKTVYTGGTVPAGTTWESFLEAMLCVEKFPGTISGTSAFTVSCGNINPGLSTTGTVEVGTLITLNKVVANNTTASQSITVGVFSGDGKVYGYKIGASGNHISAKEYTETLKPTLKSSSKALKVTFTGFTDAVNSGSVISEKTGEGEISSVTMYAMSGTNKVKVYQTGDTYTSSSAVTAGTIYAATNLKNYYKSDKVSPNTYTPSCSVVEKTASDTTEYTVTGEFKYFIGDITDKYDSTYWETDRSSVIRGLKTSGWANTSAITKTHTFKQGTKQQTVAVPSKYKNVSGLDGFKGTVEFNLVKTIDFTNAQNYISSYNIFVAESKQANGLGADSEITITIK